jgi:hypothetical protein
MSGAPINSGPGLLKPRSPSPGATTQNQLRASANRLATFHTWKLSQSDSTAFQLLLDAYATRLLAEPLIHPTAK